MSGIQTLHPNYLPYRLAEFFENNPDEELTYEDARIKFGCTQQQLTFALARCRSAGKNVEAVHVIRAKP